MCRWSRLPSPLLAALAACLIAAAPLCAQRVSDDERISQLLERLQLPRLQMLHLEQQLPRLSAQRRVEAGKQLADLYAGQLMTSTPEEQDVLRKRIERLIAAVPQADTPGLGVMLLQAAFQQAEKDATQWLSGGDLAAKQAAAPQLARLVPDLRQRQQRLRESVEALNDRLDEPGVPDEQVERLEAELRRVTVLSLRATFLTGWASYYQALLNGDGAALDMARAMFRQLLMLDQDGAERTADWMGIESPARARSLIGLALVETALGNLSDGEQCFELLQREPTPPEIRDQAGQWQVRGLLNAGQRDGAVEAGKKLVAEFGRDASPGKAQLCATLIKAGFGAEPRDTEMAQLGLEGLAKIGEFRLLRQLLDKHGGALENPEGFYLTWVHGQQLMQQADKSKDAGDYAAAAGALRRALSSSDASQAGQKAVAQCRNELAWCLYHSRQYRDAASQYQQASAALASLGESEAAAKAAWAASVALQKGAADNAALESDRKAALQSLTKEFPDTEYARKARYELTRMGGAAGDELAALQRVRPEDPNYLDARFDICLVRHRRWSDSRGTTSEPKEAAGAVRAAEEFLRLPAAKTPARRMRVALIGCEAAAQGKPPQPEARRRLLAAAAAEAGSVGDPRLLASFHYLSLLDDLSAGRTEQAQQHAQWLQENPAGRDYRRTALMVVAQGADAAAAAASGAPAAERRAALQQAKQVYEQLSESLGDEPETLAANRNALVALFKLASYQLQLGEAPAAAANFERLLQLDGKNRKFLKGAAESQFRARRFEDSLEHWRTLLRAARDGEDPWYEAKYHQIACLLNTNPGAARQVLQQFRILHPDVPAAWKSKFEQVEQRLK